MDRRYRAWNKEKKLIPVMIGRYCRGKHKGERKEQAFGRRMCAKCRQLTEYALFRLEKCPFKENKKFCSFCKIHCYQPVFRAKIKDVMKYSGPRMLFSHPVFAVSHVVQMLGYKKSLAKKNAERAKENDR